jgi:hypothetical protein
LEFLEEALQCDKRNALIISQNVKDLKDIISVTKMARESGNISEAQLEYNY